VSANGTQPLVAIVGLANVTNAALAAAWTELGLRTEVLATEELARLRPGDIAIGRLDLLPTLDGIEPRLESLLELAQRGVRLLNRPSALLRAHDKLLTAHALAEAGLPHPQSAHLGTAGEHCPLEPPVVVKPRYGSWGRDVTRCSTREELAACLASVEGRSWFFRDGALVQELVPPTGWDLRLVIAGGTVAGACARRAAAGEWRTNTSLGGVRSPAHPDAEALRLGVAAAAVVGADLVGVDLMRTPLGGWTIIELNGAVDFDRTCSLPGRDVFVDVAEALDLPLRMRKEDAMTTQLHNGLRSAIDVRATGACPMCGSDAWAAGGRLVAVMDADEDPSPISTLESLPFVCTACGFLRLHAVQALETIDD
jgi:RimK family alpha-L-glutamate ligase